MKTGLQTGKEFNDNEKSQEIYTVLLALSISCFFFLKLKKIQGPQVVYTASIPGYVMTQGPDGIPMVVPMQVVDGL